MEDPLPLRYITGFNPFIFLKRRKNTCFIALVLCLFLGMGILAFPHLVREVGNPGTWIVKVNLNVTQAPRSIVFGALAVLPQNIFQMRVESPQLRENSDIDQKVNLNQKNWLVMTWYSSNYI